MVIWPSFTGYHGFKIFGCHSILGKEVEIGCQYFVFFLSEGVICRLQIVGRRSQVAGYRPEFEVHENGQRLTDFEKKTDCFAV